MRNLRLRDGNTPHRHNTWYSEELNPGSSCYSLPFQNNRELLSFLGVCFCFVFFLWITHFSGRTVWVGESEHAFGNKGQHLLLSLKVISLHFSHSSQSLSLKLLIIHANWRALWHRQSKIGVKDLDLKMSGNLRLIRKQTKKHETQLDGRSEFSRPAQTLQVHFPERERPAPPQITSGLFSVLFLTSF